MGFSWDIISEYEEWGKVGVFFGQLVLSREGDYSN